MASSELEFPLEWKGSGSSSSQRGRQMRLGIVALAKQYSIDQGEER